MGKHDDQSIFIIVSQHRISTPFASAGGRTMRAKPKPLLTWWQPTVSKLPDREIDRIAEGLPGDLEFGRLLLQLLLRFGKVNRVGRAFQIDARE